MGTDQAVRAVAKAALEEDLGDRGDVTSAATVPPDARARATVVARQAGVVAGMDVAAAVFDLVDPATAWTARAVDGDAVGAGEPLATVEGSARSLLAAERAALNLLGHLCGVATLTRRYVDAVGAVPAAAVVRDTRKTLPGLRALQKAAVAAGGGVNHRFGLSDGLLIKDNHVEAAGGVAAATQAAVAAGGDADPPLPVQVEVDTLGQLEEALAAGARSVLCDNFDLDELAKAVARCHATDPPTFVEASGGITLDTVAAIAATGVDAVAVGGLTHSAPALDVALDFE